MVFRVPLEAHFVSYLVDLKAPVCTSRYLHSLHLTTYILNIKYQVRFRFQDNRTWLENFIYLMIKIPSKISYLILTTTQYIQMASISWYDTCLRRKWFCHIFIRYARVYQMSRPSSSMITLWPVRQHPAYFDFFLEPWSTEYALLDTIKWDTRLCHHLQ